MSKRKIRINAMDFVILAVIAAAAALLLYVFVWSDAGESAQPETMELTYVVEIVGMDEQFENAVQDGDRVEDAVKRGLLGTVSGTPEVRDTLKAEYDQDTRSEVYVKVPGKSNLYVTITADAAVTPQGYMVNGQYVYVGAPMSMLFPNLKCDGYCIQLDAAE